MKPTPSTGPSASGSFPKKIRLSKPDYGHFGKTPASSPEGPPPAAGPLGVHQNLDTAGVITAQQNDVTEAQLRASYAHDDPRYAGGDAFDLQNEQTGL